MPTVTEFIRDHISQELGFAIEVDEWRDFGKRISYKTKVVEGIPFVFKSLSPELAGLDEVWRFVDSKNEHGKPVDAVRKKLLETTGD